MFHKEQEKCSNQENGHQHNQNCPPAKIKASFICEYNAILKVVYHINGVSYSLWSLTVPASAATSKAGNLGNARAKMVKKVEIEHMMVAVAEE